jgi:putative RecB family exonuclease
VTEALLRTSHSRVDRHDRCEHSYFLHYIERRPPLTSTPAAFGSALHGTFETLIGEAVASEHIGPLSEERALELWQTAFRQEDLRGPALFSEGREIVQGFVRTEGAFDWRTVLAVEQPFSIRVGDVLIVGIIDRVDAVGPRGIRLIDYKSSLRLFTPAELATNPQLSLYAAAAKQLWPWAEPIELVYGMVRHGVSQVVVRTPEQIQATLEYVVGAARHIATSTDFPARLGPHCVYCDHRQACSAYADAVAGTRHAPAAVDLADLDAVARERQELVAVNKIVEARCRELDEVIKAHLVEHNEVTAAGTRFRMLDVESRSYQLADTLAVLSRATGRPEEELRPKLTVIDKRALDNLLRQIERREGRATKELVRAELDALADTRYTARLWAKEI